MVAFDFDGTITSQDTLRLFLTRIRGPRDLASSFVRHAPRLGLALQGGAARDRAKRLICMDVLGASTVRQPSPRPTRRHGRSNAP